MQARADLAEAEATLRLADSDYQRAEKLAAQNVVAPADLDRARSTRDAARARVNAAKEQVRLRERMDWLYNYDATAIAI